MTIKKKLFLQNLGSWMIMPFTLGYAQLTTVVVHHEFVVAVLAVVSISPIKIYLNEVYASYSVKHKKRLKKSTVILSTIGIISLSLYSMHSFDLSPVESAVILVFSGLHVALSYIACVRVLDLQFRGIISARSSYIVGLVAPLTVFLVVVVYNAIKSFDLRLGYFLYSYIVLPPIAQLGYIQFTYCKDRIVFDNMNEKINGGFSFESIFYIMAIVLTLIAQKWKINLVNVTSTYSVIAVYALSPITVLWIVYTKSYYLTRTRPVSRIKVGLIIFVLSLLTCSIKVSQPLLVFTMAIFTQLIALRFIDEVRFNITLRQTKAHH